jgi:hypothetical protein
LPLWSVVLTVISSVTITSPHGTKNEETVALLLARAKLEELELLDKQQLTQGKEGTFRPEWPDYSWKAEISPAPVPVFKTLTVTVTWGTDRRTLSLAHYLLQEK